MQISTKGSQVQMVLHYLYFRLSTFSDLNNEEFLYTGKGKKLKFTHVAPKHVSNKTAFRRFYRSIFIN